MRRIVSASRPSSSRIARAAATISRARGVRPSGALEAIARAHPVAEERSREMWSAQASAPIRAPGAESDGGECEQRRGPLKLCRAL